MRDVKGYKMKNNTGCIEPLYEEILTFDVNNLIKLFFMKDDLMVLNSSMVMEGYGRYSFICFDGFASFSSKGSNHYWNDKLIDIQNPFDFISEMVNKYKIKKIDCLPPLQGGVVGYFGYEASHYLEDLPRVEDNIKLPDIYLKFYDSVIAVDHVDDRCWIISTGFSEGMEGGRIKRARENILEIKKIIANESIPVDMECIPDIKERNLIHSNFSRKSYIDAIQKTKEFILNGDIYEANITQQFNSTLSESENLLYLYFKLMKVNSAPFSAFVKIKDNGSIISASPERFIKLTDNLMEVCPIKGTRKRSSEVNEDKLLAEELLSSEKDHAENIMIVDLMRNDISRVCQANTVKVDELCSLKSFETVHHLVSKITGRLQEKLKAMDVLKATFPPGSVTGAPKIRSMEVISELEMQGRGPYCGCLGYISFTGDMDMSVVIRTYFINKNKLFFSAGGAVVSDSDPEDEYEESLTKARALVEALTL
jgi:para-aminobenzoate synthetase component 1